MQPSPDLDDRFAQIAPEHLVLVQEIQLGNANFRIHQLDAEIARLKSLLRAANG
jgi:hypothetical protein